MNIKNLSRNNCGVLFSADFNRSIRFYGMYIVYCTITVLKNSTPYDKSRFHLYVTGSKYTFVHFYYAEIVLCSLPS